MKPDSVRKAEEEADRLHAELYPVPDAVQEASDAPDVSTTVETDESPAVEPEPDDGAGEPGVAEPSSPAPVNAAPEAGEDWRQKYLTLQGKYNTETATLRNQLGEAVYQLNQTRTPGPMPTGVPGTVPGFRQQVQVESPPPQLLVKPEEVQEYGPDFVDFMKRLVQDVTRPEFERVGSRIGEVQTQAKQTGYAGMLQELGQRVPDFVVMDKDKGFNDWLDLVDEFSGRTRRDLFQEAEGRLDAGRVAAFFNRYKQENGPAQEVTPARQGLPAQLPTPQESPRGTLALETMVGPGRATSSAPLPNTKATYTEADLARFYADVRRGVYRNRPDEQSRIEQEIIQAGAEGRIQIAPRF